MCRADFCWWLGDRKVRWCVEDQFLFCDWIVSWKSKLKFHGILFFPCFQRAEQLSNTLKKIATTETFTNFNLFYMDFVFHESKSLVFVLTVGKHGSCGVVLCYTAHGANQAGSSLTIWHDDSQHWEKIKHEVLSDRLQINATSSLHHPSKASEATGPVVRLGRLEASSLMESPNNSCQVSNAFFCVC